MVTPKQLFVLALAKKFALPAFNVSTVEQIRVVAETAARLRSPVLVETSEGEASLLTYPVAAAAVAAWKATLRIPLFLNADHHHTQAPIASALRAGYTYVHIDASRLPMKENIKVTKRVVAKARAKGVLVEGELGAIGGSSERHAGRGIVPATALTSPEEAVMFVRATGIDALAANVGNVHGLWAAGKPTLVIEHIRTMRRLLPKTFLTLHGGSGIPPAQIRSAIAAGITKVNINTELRVAFIGGLRTALRQAPEETTPYKLYPVAMKALQRIVEEKIRLCGAAGRLP